MSQISFFDGNNKFFIDKPIRLIELFAGYGSQHLSLKYLGAEFESYKICEWAVKSIQAYKDLHFAHDNNNYSENLSCEQVVNYLYEKGISADYNKPMTYEQIKRMGEKKCRQVYNNIFATHNLVNITQAKANDLEIVDTDKYCYVLTYSFPCQDLSRAGQCKGMAKGSGTRSGMLWEVERLLCECDKLPQVLIMENVQDVIGQKNISHFAKWLERLEGFGYKCFYKVLNGKDYGIPQNRDRCFMISILGDYYFEFPDQIELKKHLKDFLEDEVDEKYYLSNNGVNYILSPKRGMCTDINADVAQTITAKGQNNWTGSFISTDIDHIEKSKTIGSKTPTKVIMKNGLCFFVQEATKKGYAEAYEGDSVNFEQPNSKTRRGRVGKQCAQTLTTSCNQGVVVNARIRKLTPKECWRLMGVHDEDFEKAAKNQSNSSLYHLAGDSIITNVLMAIFNEMLKGNKDNESET